MGNDKETKGCCGAREASVANTLHVNKATDVADAMGGERVLDASGVLEADHIKAFVRERYGFAATHKSGSGCGCEPEDPAFSFVGEEYADHQGYEADADLGLGCGVPTDFAEIEPGDTVLDLGSGAGIDAFIAREHTGPTGTVIGVDFTPEMIARARENVSKFGYDNVRFVEGDIEDLPIDSSSIDVILSNCVLNLVPRKRRAFEEMYRVLKPGGHFAVSDVVIQGKLPDRLRESAQLYAECVSGAIAHEEYMSLLAAAGFTDLRIVRERTIYLGEEFLNQMASAEEIEAFDRSGGIKSVTIWGKRSAGQ